jgi:fructose-specific PTS system IIA-like component
MSREYSFSFPLPNGLHARPASHLEEAARLFRSKITLRNEQNGRYASLRNVFALVATDTNCRDACRLVIEGVDEEAALAALTAYLADGFLHCDDTLPAPVVEVGMATLPRSLRATGLTDFLRGAAVCQGLGWGRIVCIERPVTPPEMLNEQSRGVEAEMTRFETAVAKLLKQLARAQAAATGTESDLLNAHLGILRDPTFTDQITTRIRAGAATGAAITSAVEVLATELRGARNSLLHDRVLDFEDIAGQLLELIYGSASTLRVPELSGPSVVVADSLTPGQLLSLDRQYVQALVLGHAGQTSHTIILARSFAIPALTGVVDAASRLKSGIEVIVDAHLGLVIPAPSDSVRFFYTREKNKLNNLAARLATEAKRPASTADGRRLEVCANIVSAAETAAAIARGAEGIGLFRTELFFTDRATPPSEEEQYAAYAKTLQTANNRPVIFRTLDIGGDKPVPFLPLPKEDNPFLGCRGVRLYADHSTLLKTQLRALLRAAAHGPTKILIPMVASLDEARLARRLLDEARSEIPPGTVVGKAEFGIMVEVPAVAFAIDELAAEVDFFSIGTNDLCQYFFAADRGNASVARHYNVLSPAFMRLLKKIVDAAHAHGKWIGLCGEMGENVHALPLLVGMGLDEISLAAPRIPATKAALATLNSSACIELLNTALRCPSADEVMQLVEAHRRPALPLLAPELVVFDVDASTKVEAIRALVDCLHVAGRTDAPAEVEEAVWRREETCSTGFGEGFAVPHCKTDSLNSPTVAIARLRNPVDWQAFDNRPVDIVILLGIRASDPDQEHLKTLARLSRLAMRDEFRDLLRNETSPQALVAALQTQLAPTA